MALLGSSRAVQLCLEGRAKIRRTRLCSQRGVHWDTQAGSWGQKLVQKIRSLINYYQPGFVDKARLEICGTGLGWQTSLFNNPSSLGSDCVWTYEVLQKGKNSVIHGTNSVPSHVDWMSQCPR